jgi:hypothetical protein
VRLGDFDDRAELEFDIWANELEGESATTDPEVGATASDASRPSVMSAVQAGLRALGFKS